MNITIYRLLSSTAALAVIALASPVGAQSPQSPTVAAGTVSVSRQGSTTVVTQTTEKGVVDWRSFSIGSNEAVRFDQPGRSSVTLNRVTGSEASRIDGALSATGQVWLANPNGVLIGPSGQVNVGGLLATTGRIDAQEFQRSGRAHIDQVAKDAAIVNQGSVNIAEGGYAALAAAAIRNEGVIAARAGAVALGSGKAMTLDFAGDKLIQFQVTQALDEAPAGADALVANAGTIAAQGGVVLISARAAKGVMDNVVNLSGHVISNQVRVDGGTVIFGDGGAVKVSAKVDASSATGKGGKVEVLGEKVGLMDGASIDASGSLGGGTVLVGGDWQGGGEGRNAQVAYVAPTASINVDATQSGNGGKAVVWADGATRFQGSITARGGVNGGDGGRVETSGKRALAIGNSARVNTGARGAKAKPGSWLLDPNDITISAASDGNISAGPVFSAASDAPSTVSVATLNAALATGDVTVQTTSGYAGSGDITFSGGTISYSGSSAPRSLTLSAYRDILIQNGATITLSGAAHSVTLNARNEDSSGSLPGAILVAAGARIETTGGSITLVGGAGGAGSARGGGSQAAGVAIGGVLSSGAGPIILSGYSPTSSGVAISGQLSTTNGAITINGEGGTAAIDVTGVIAASGTGAVTLTGVRGAGPGSTNIRVGPSATITTGGGALTLNGQSTLNGSGPDNHGVVIASGATIGTSDGAIQVLGAASVTGGPNIGVRIGDGGGAATLSASGVGSITINGVGGGGGVGIATAGAVINANYGDITLTANSYSVASASFSSSKGATRIQPIGANVSVGVGAGVGTLQIDQGVIDSISGKLIIGRADLAATLTLGAGFTLHNDLTLLTGSGAVNLAGAVDSGGTAKSLTVTTATGGLSFAGALGAGTPLSSLVVTKTGSGGTITLPTLSTGDLTVSIESATLNQSGDLTVSGTALLSTGYSGQITFPGTNNTIGTLRVYSLNSSISVKSDFVLGASTVGSLNLDAEGVVTQTGPLTAGGIAVNGSNSAVYNLTDPGNAIEALLGTAGSITVVNGPTVSLKPIYLGAYNSLSLTQAGQNRSIDFIGPVNVYSSMVNLTSEGTINSGTFGFTGSGATINLSVGGIGSAVNVQAGNTVNVLAGTVAINAATTPSQPSTPSVPSSASTPSTPAPTPTVASIPTVASAPTVASVPTIASTPTIASIPTLAPTLASTPSTPSVFSVASTPTQAIAAETILPLPAPVTLFNNLTNAENRGSLLTQILPSKPNFDLAPAPPVPSPPTNNANSVANIPSGALIPIGLSAVPGSGARLANTQTIKVDGADSGGIGGQVIAGATAQGGSEPIVPGLISQSQTVGANLPRVEPPLAQQPSTLNEESLLD